MKGHMFGRQIFFLFILFAVTSVLTAYACLCIQGYAMPRMEAGSASILEMPGLSLQCIFRNFRLLTYKYSTTWVLYCRGCV